jgi:hypothetical protein
MFNYKMYRYKHFVSLRCSFVGGRWNCIIIGRLQIAVDIIIYVGFEVLTAVVMKSTVFWDITPCSPLSVSRRFGGTYRLHREGRKNKLSKKAGGKL